VERLEDRITPAFMIGTTTLPDGTVGSSYLKAGKPVTITARNGSGHYTFSLGDDSYNGGSPGSYPNLGAVLPEGMSLVTQNNQAVLEGTPRQPGVYDIIITAEDTQAPGHPVVREALSLDILPLISLSLGGSSSTVFQDDVGQPFSQQVTPSGGTGPYTYLLSGGELPPGLDINHSTGLISGSPAFWGEYPFVILATGQNGNSGVQSFVINVPAPLTFTTTGAFTGGTTRSSVTIALASPVSGLAVGDSVTGQGIRENTTIASISPTAITLSSSATQTNASVALAWSPPQPLNILPASVSDYYAVVGKPYDLAVSAGNSDAYDYTIQNTDTAPAHTLTLIGPNPYGHTNGGTNYGAGADVSFTPAKETTYHFKLGGYYYGKSNAYFQSGSADPLGNTAYNSGTFLNYTVNAYSAGKNEPYGLNYGLPVATVGSNYDLTIAVNGAGGVNGTPTVLNAAFTKSSSGPRHHLAVSATGNAIHVASTATVKKPTVTGPDEITAEIQFKPSAGGTYTVTQTFLLSVEPEAPEPIQIVAKNSQNGNLPAFTIGQKNYQATLSVSSSNDQFSFALAETSSHLPPGLELTNGNELKFKSSSSPTSASVFNVIVYATDMATQVKTSRVFQLPVVSPDNYPTFKVSSTTSDMPTEQAGVAVLPLASPGVKYNATITASAGTITSVQFAQDESKLPAALTTDLTYSIKGSVLTISGTPGIVNQYDSGAATLVVTAKNGNDTTTQDFTLAVGYTPQQLQSYYGISNTKFGSIKGNGSGQTVVIIGDDDAPNLVSSSDPNFQSSDLVQFDQLMNLNAYSSSSPPTFTKLDAFGGTDLPAASSNTHETTQDVEMVHALAPMANIILIEDNGNFYSAVQTALALHPAVIESSFHGEEEGVEPPASIYLQHLYSPTTSSSKPVTFVFTAGDEDDATSHTVDWNVDMGTLVAGMTLLNTTSANGFTESALGGSGGGASAYASQLPWENGVVQNVSTTMQTSPIVAFNGSTASPPAFYNSYEGDNPGGTYSTAGPSLNYSWELGNGTSIAAPAWAALIAIADQGRAHNGLSAPLTDAQTLSLLFSNAGSTNFHQINQMRDGTVISPQAFGNYNPWVGLGSPIANKLLPLLSQPTVHASVSSLDLGSTAYGVAGTPQSFILLGINLTQPITITSPCGVELSKDGSLWSTSLSFTPTAEVPYETIFVRIAATALGGPITGCITAVSGSTKATILVQGTAGHKQDVTAQVKIIYPAYFLTVNGITTATFSIYNLGPALIGPLLIDFAALPPGVTLLCSSRANGAPSHSAVKVVVTFWNPLHVNLGSLAFSHPAEVLLY
jgi:hypothetical protein